MDKICVSGQRWASVSASWFYVAVSARLVGLSVPCDAWHGPHLFIQLMVPRFPTPFEFDLNPHQIGQENNTSMWRCYKALAIDSGWLQPAPKNPVADIFKT